MRAIRLKTVLWFLVGILGTVTVARFLKGLGATTALTDATPWGLWIAFDVVSGVALAAGGFVVAAIVYIFGQEKYHQFARPAILTAFLGYLAVATGLLYDLGIPLHIWHPLVYRQPHSVLFEVAMCVMLYLTVLFLEFSPAILEHPRLQFPVIQRIHAVLKRLTIPLVIAGIVLSTLHQSSLGSLFLIAPYRVHPLWYSPLIWVLFFLSAAGLGRAVVIVETLFSDWYLSRRPPVELLGRLGLGASALLWVYLALRLGDIVLSHRAAGVTLSDPLLWVFLAEVGITVSAAVLLLIPRVRYSVWGLTVSASLAILGVLGYRFNVTIVAFYRPADMPYFPSLSELMVSVGLVAGCVLLFLFFIENLNVLPKEADEEHAPPSRRPTDTISPYMVRPVFTTWLAPLRNYSLAAAAGAALALALIANGIRTESMNRQTPVSPPLQIATSTTLPVSSPLESLLAPIRKRSGSPSWMVFDANRDGRVVIFDHDEHAHRLGGNAACGQCHHAELPFHLETPCSDCHRDLYLSTDLFHHAGHVAKLGGDGSCIQCHTDESSVKTRATSTACRTCHASQWRQTQYVSFKSDVDSGRAPAYEDALHALCRNCHLKKAGQEGVRKDLGECRTCHHEVPASYLQVLGPYAGRGALK
ncbi:MAG: Ni/Fe-hydrogenase cytochrome b subunit [Acidobacteriota bacterium]